MSFLIRNPEIMREKLHADASLKNFRKRRTLHSLLADMFPDKDGVPVPVASSSFSGILDLYNLTDTEEPDSSSVSQNSWKRKLPPSPVKNVISDENDEEDEQQQVDKDAEEFQKLHK